MSCHEYIRLKNKTGGLLAQTAGNQTQSEDICYLARRMPAEFLEAFRFPF
jgi:hypothetical protein